MSLSPNPTNGIHTVLSRIKFFFEIKNWRIRLDRFYKLNPDILVDLNCFDLKNAHSIVMVIIDL
jgi:hypothetical protein